MVYKYTRKSEQQSWDAGAMQRAIEAVTNDGMAYSTAAKTFSVSRNTLRRRVLGKNIDSKGNRKVLGKYRAVFTEEQEAELVRHILDMEVRFFGVTILDLRSLAYSLAEKNGIPNNRRTKMAGLDWVAVLRHQHPEISLREPEQTSAARAQAFDKHNCGVPLNQDVFTEADYVAAECTDVPLQQPRPNQELREASQTKDPYLRQLKKTWKKKASRRPTRSN
ncbi:hypothetical protein JTB14_032448 [Gonioctena quinquepunctata]|nr:hypothetical protein JTB14_032448 [Gonioctena quinquepunctata]